jgi:hypothetical protein
MHLAETNPNVHVKIALAIYWDSEGVNSDQRLNTLKSIIATLTGFIVVIFSSFWYLHGQQTLRTADFRLITH